MERINFRHLAKADIPLLAAWERTERPYPWEESHFAGVLVSAAFSGFVIEADGRLVGCAVVQMADDEATLLNILVSPAERRKGRASVLIEKVVLWCRSRGASHLLLDVDPLNNPAVRLYQKSGFESVGLRPHAYPRGEDAMVMRKNI